MAAPSTTHESPLVTNSLFTLFLPEIRKRQIRDTDTFINKYGGISIRCEPHTGDILIGAHWERFGLVTKTTGRASAFMVWMRK